MMSWSLAEARPVSAFLSLCDMRESKTLWFSSVTRSERRSASWPAETRFITPSFPTNSIGMLDLNSVAVGVSPAFSLEVEHPTGEEFASHLRGVAKFFELPIRPQTDVIRVAKVGDDFLIDTAEETLKAAHVIWAAGEFQYPRRKWFRRKRTLPTHRDDRQLHGSRR